MDWLLAEGCVTKFHFIHFNRLMIKLDQHDGNFLSICRHYRAMLVRPVVPPPTPAGKGAEKGAETPAPSSQAPELSPEEKAERKLFHRSAAVYLVLSPFDNEQSDLLHRMLEEKAMEDIPSYKSVCKHYQPHIIHLFLCLNL